MEKNEIKSIQWYLSKQKKAFYTAYIVWIIVFLITLFFWFKLEGHIKELLWLEIGAFIFMTMSNINVTITFNNIIKYSKNNKLEEETKNILYWNYDTLWLTNNYIIITKGRKVCAFQYQDIKEIKKKEYYAASGYWATPTFHRDLEIKLHNGQVYKAMMYNAQMDFEDVIEDVTPILLEKNKDIIQVEN